MKQEAKLSAAARIVLGLVFCVFGLNGFMHFIPIPPVHGAAAQFFAGLAAADYFFPLLAATQTVAGAALLVRRFVPLALILLAPIVTHIVALHVFVVRSGLAMAVLVLGLEVILAWSYRDAFRPVLRARAQAAPMTSLSAQGTCADARPN
jgi:hypothetical protein